MSQVSRIPGPDSHEERDDKEIRGAALFETTFEQAALGIALIRADGQLIRVNRKLCEIVGYSEDELRSRTALDITHPEDRAADIERMRQLVACEAQAYTLEKRYRHRSGRTVWVAVTVALVRRPDATPDYFIKFVEDVTERKVAAARIEFLAHHDPLTELPNRTLSHERFEFAVSYADRGKRRLAVMLLDLDNFKSINDALGHRIGDEVLKAISRRLTRCVREMDTVSRQGGDEFLVILADINGMDDIAVAADKILGALRTPNEVEGHTLAVTGSVGIAVYPDDGGTLDRLIQKADTAMYVAKGVGGNDYRYFDEKFNTAATDALLIRNDLRSALAANEFVLHYQPQFDLASGAVVGAEALIRWRSPKRGLVPPSQFIGAAEDSGLILPIGEWVLEQACRHAASWRKTAPGMHVGVAVNLSVAQFTRENLETSIMAALLGSGLDPRALELELTETILIKDPESVLHTLARLRRLGVTFSIDDFGTGYSSLTYLKRFPVHRLKIDKSFVDNVIDRAEDAEIVKAIMHMARALGLQTVAEGVEEQRIADFLRGNGCDHAQGYLFARPMPVSDFIRFLAEHAKAAPQGMLAGERGTGLGFPGGSTAAS
jgi:diguanylate cyclase (GGDEF)-like protein/PAS domain S-box-containing protein